MKFSDMLGRVRARYKTVYYEDGDPVGNKEYYENLGAIKPANDTNAKVVINAFLALYSNATIDQNKTTVTVEANLEDLVAEEQTITEAENVYWKTALTSVDQLGNTSTKSIGAFKGNLTAETTALINNTVRALLNLTYNSYKQTNLSGVSYPYKEA